MKKDIRFAVAYVALCAVLLTVPVIVWVFKSKQEAETFNAHNDGPEVTTWQAMWSEFRVVSK